MQSLGGVTRVGTALAAGIPRHSLRRAIASGELLRPRKGWVCLPGTAPRVLEALGRGCRVGCVSALAHHGVWILDDTIPHLAMPRHAGRPGEGAHRCSPSWAQHPEPIERIPDALLQAVLCCDREAALCAIDSVLNRGRMTLRDVQTLLGSLPPRFASLIDELDPASESGIETLVRVRLRRRGLAIQSQVLIAGFRVDLVVGDRLVIEADGRRWHDDADTFEADRRRDLDLARLGYIVVRLSYDQVVRQWALVELTLLALVRRGEHHWRAVHRAEGLVH